MFCPESVDGRKGVRNVRTASSVNRVCNGVRPTERLAGISLDGERG